MKHICFSPSYFPKNLNFSPPLPPPPPQAKRNSVLGQQFIFYKTTPEGLARTHQGFLTENCERTAGPASITLSVLTVNYSLPPATGRISRRYFEGTPGGGERAVIHPPPPRPCPPAEAGNGLQRDGDMSGK